MIKFTFIPKKAIWHLAIWQNFCFGQFHHSKIFNLVFLSFSSESIERIHFTKRSGLSCWETEKDVLLPVTQLGKEDTLIILLSAWDRSRVENPNPQNSAPQNGPSRGLDFKALHLLVQYKKFWFSPESFWMYKRTRAQGLNFHSFFNFSCRFLNPTIFSNLNHNCSRSPWKS